MVPAAALGALLSLLLPGALASSAPPAPPLAVEVDWASFLARSDMVFGLIGLAGAVFLFLLGLESLRAGPLDVAGATAPSGGVIKAVLTNLLNPHPYLFWVTVGGPLVAAAYDHSLLSALGFLAGFFVMLCGAKAGIALLVGRGRHLLTSRAYTWALRVLGGVMWVFAVAFAWDAIGRLAA